jgi:hypothetical protein
MAAKKKSSNPFAFARSKGKKKSSPYQSRRFILLVVIGGYTLINLFS